MPQLYETIATYKVALLLGEFLRLHKFRQQPIKGELIFPYISSHFLENFELDVGREKNRKPEKYLV